jgi:hypothetical protein
MSINYSKLATVAKQLITQFGTDWTIRREIKGSYNPATNTQPAQTTNNYTVKAARLEYRKYKIDGEIIQKDDFQLYVEAKDLGIFIETYDKIVDNEDNIYEIVDVKPIKPGDTVVYYELQLRK